MADPTVDRRTAEPPRAGNVPIDVRTAPERYRHWHLRIEGRIATLTLDVDESGGLAPGYELKLNSYDLGVDVELADAVQRLRFEHPEVAAVVIRSDRERVFCAGANIRMLGTSSHAHKVAFCKFTNETRCAIEDASAHSGQRYLCAINGTSAGGGYELAIAADWILLVDDGASAVSLPGGAAARRATRHRRAGAGRGQAQSAPRPGRRLLDHRGRDPRRARARMGPGGRARALLALRGCGRGAGAGARDDQRSPGRRARHPSRRSRAPHRGRAHRLHVRRGGDRSGPRDPRMSDPDARTDRGTARGSRRTHGR